MYIRHFFLDKHDHILDLCVTIYHKNLHVPPSLIDLGDGNMLLSSSESQPYVVKCNDHPPEHLKPCSLCVLKMGCGCSLKGNNLYIAPSLNSCSDTKKGVTVRHPINAQILLHTWKYKFKFNYSASALTDSPLKFSVPELPIRNLNMSAYAAVDRKIALDLQKVVKLSEGEKHIYYDPVDELLDKTNFFFGLFGPSMFDWTILVMLIAVLMLIIAAGILGFKLHSLQITMASMSLMIGKVKAEETCYKDLKINLYLTWAVLLVMFGVLFMYVMRLGIKIIYQTQLGQGIVLRFKDFVSPSPITSLVLEISSLEKILYIPVMKTHFPPSRLLLNEGRIITKGFIVERVRSFLKMQWPILQFITVNGDADLWFKLPRKIKIPMFRTKICEEILSARHFCRLLADCNGIYVEVKQAEQMPYLSSPSENKATVIYDAETGAITL